MTIHGLSSLAPGSSKRPYTQRQKRVDQVPPGNTPLDGPVSASKQRELFESRRGYPDMDSSAVDMYQAPRGGSRRSTHSPQSRYSGITSSTQAMLAKSLIERWEARETHPPSGTQYGHITPIPLQSRLFLSSVPRNATTPTATQHFDHRNGRRPLIEKSSESPGIATPIPIAPPNHECEWKERYMVLAAEIRQLKADMLTRQSIGDSGILTTRHEEEHIGDDVDIRGLTIVLHFKNRDDIVVDTDLTQDNESSD